ncbi:MAG: hypothetical protein IAF94_01830 [Pirellulaceae bacterium]|nr:hypothetical protein [Pirellulaceae bacterium]
MIAIMVGIGKQYYDRRVTLERRARELVELEELGVLFDHRDGVVVGLHFPHNVPKPRHFQMATEFGEIEKLSAATGGSFSDSDATKLLANPKLKELRIPGHPGVTDQSLKTIGKLNSLELLELTKTSISDQGLVELAHLSKLRLLQLTGTAITSQGMEHLRPLQSLQMLSIDHTNVDDSGLATIAELRGLGFISLSNTKVRGGGLAALAKLPKLQGLDLSGCSLVDGSGLAELKQISSLTLFDSRIPPGLLSHLQAMDNLRDVNLHGSAVDEEQLVELGNASLLKILILGKTRASEVAMRELRAKLPHARIEGEPRDP